MNTGSSDRSTGSPSLVLWIGFGALLFLMVASAIVADRTLKQIEANTAVLRNELLRREGLLDRLRLGLYHSSIDIHDYLIEPDAAQTRRRRRDLERLRNETTATLRQFEEGLAPEDSGPVRELDQDLAEYWRALQPIFHWDPETVRAQGDAYLRGEILPRHQQLFRLTSRIATIEERHLDAATSNVAKVFASFNRELTASGLLIIAAGILVAGVSIRRILELEKLSEMRYQETVQAREELQQLSARLVVAQEDERRRLSRELHDEVGQSLSAVLMELGNLEAALPPADSLSRERLNRVKELAEASVGEIRNMALLLRPSMLDDLGLVPALRWQAREVARRTGMKVKVAAENVGVDSQEDLGETLPDEYRTCIYRIVQEALNNCARHAQAKGVRVTVRQEPEQIAVSVQDDGIGFEARQDKGVGILGMEERVRPLGGVFRVDSEPGGGTVVSVLLPFHPARAAEASEANL
jgi:signal transduction histidine kinase